MFIADCGSISTHKTFNEN